MNKNHLLFSIFILNFFWLPIAIGMEHNNEVTNHKRKKEIIFPNNSDIKKLKSEDNKNEVYSAHDSEYDLEADETRYPGQVCNRALKVIDKKGYIHEEEYSDEESESDNDELEKLLESMRKKNIVKILDS